MSIASYRPSVDMKFEDYIWPDQDEEIETAPYVFGNHRFTDYSVDVGMGSIAQHGDLANPIGVNYDLEGMPQPVETSWEFDHQNDRVRLDDLKQHLRRKAAAVVNDDAALSLLASMYSKRVVETAAFDFCQDGRALAKLTAAHFCEIGANTVYITYRGQRFMDVLKAK